LKKDFMWSGLACLAAAAQVTHPESFGTDLAQALPSDCLMEK
jgi:hypothetical protein